MIRTDIVKMYKDIHTWVGIVSGLCLFIAFYAGALTMFEGPIQRWATAPSGLPDAVSLDRAEALVDAALAEHPEAARGWRVHVKTGPESPARVSWDIGHPRHPDATFGAAFDAEGHLVTAELNASPVAQLIDTLHQQVGLPLDHEIAMPIMGAIALLYAIALVSGVIIIIPSLLKDAFNLRLGKNLKRLWLDVHNALGIFSLPFHIIMALSAVIFAFHDQIYDIQGETIYEGGIAAQWAQDVHEDPDVAPGTPLAAPSAVVARLAEQAPDFHILTLQYARDRDGHLGGRVMGRSVGHGMRGPTYGIAEFDPYTGDFTHVDYLPGQQPRWESIVTSFFALHFGNFGGEPVRWGYFVFGLAGAFLFYSGNLIWIEARRKRLTKRHGARPQTRTTRVLGALTVGVSLGSIAGMSLTLAAAKWISAWPVDLEVVHTGLYYAVFVAAILWAFRRGAGQGGADLLWLCAATTLLIPLSSLAGALMGEAGPWNWGGPVLVLDAVALAGAAGFAVLARITRKRALTGPQDSVWAAQPLQADPA